MARHSLNREKHVTTMQEFVSKHHIEIHVVQMADGVKDGGQMRRFCVTLFQGQMAVNRKKLRVPFFQDMAWTTMPTAAEVLTGLALDASGADLSFEEWCSEFGLNSDSRKAERIFKAVRQHTTKLRGFLSADQYQELTTDVEGL